MIGLGVPLPGKKAKERGAFPGRIAGHDILHYLKARYQPLQLRYVLFIGHPDPNHGTTPMLRIAHHKSQKNHLGAPDPKKKETGDRLVVRQKLVDANGHFTEYGSVISDYPYVDLNTDWDADGDGFLTPEHDTNQDHTREPEVYVGRLLYYGEDSPYAKVEDMDVILTRCIRYDLEEDIAWRYNHMVEFGQHTKTQEYLEEMGINYELISRFKSHAVGLPALKSRKGAKHIPNFEQIQDYAVGFKGCHSHGGPMGMEGFSSKVIAREAHDRHPTVLTLGACDVGNLNTSQNLTYTLLRFQSVAVSGGTGSVTGYGGNGRYVAENKLGKGEQLFAGKSVGQAHWGWYGGLYKHSKRIPMTGAKINLYGDPSVVPLRDGPEPPYPFLAKPVLGHFCVAGNEAEMKALDGHVLQLENRNDEAVEVSAASDQPWLKLSRSSILLPQGGKAELKLQLDPDMTKGFEPGVYESVVRLSAGDYSCRRRFVLKVPKREVRGVFAFEGKVNNGIGSSHGGGHGSGFSLPKSVTKYDAKNSKLPKPVPFVEGKYGKGSNTNYAVGGYVEPFEQEDFTIATWMKVNGDVPAVGKSAGKQVLMFAHGFFELARTKDGLQLSLTTYPEVKRPAKAVVLKTSKTMNAGKWYHLAFSLKQATGTLSLLVDGKVVGTAKIQARSLYGSKALSFGTFDGACDDLMIFSACLDPEYIANVGRGQYAYQPTPSDDGAGVSPTRVRLTAVTGNALADGKVLLTNKSNGTSQTLKRNKAGEWEAEGLDSEQDYQWQVVANGYKSQVWQFTTGRELLKHGIISKNLDGWVGDSQLGGKQGDLIRVNTLAGTRAETTFGENKIYKLNGILRGRGRVFAYYKDGDKRVTVFEKEVRGPRYRMAPMEVDILSPEGTHVGKELYIGLSKKEGIFEVGMLSMVEAEKGSVNFPPVVKPSLASLNATVKVGAVGYQILLTDHVVDPEGQALTFSVVDGPDWAYVQGEDTFFSNFGPPKEDIGKHVFKIFVRDAKGASMTFDLPVTVVE